LATHGFFLPSDEPPELVGALAPTAADLKLPVGFQMDSAEAVKSSQENPLLRSGLALASANRLSDGAEDGVLTALEAAGLDLWGTQLVVLSACETGVGEVTAGEGVYGLRRALVIAGAESLIMSLWQVDDDATMQLMTGYYQRLGEGQGRGDALRQVQLKMLRRAETAHPFYWAAFIGAGDWRPLTK
jgi:CHAT domain-containing protein